MDEPQRRRRRRAWAVVVAVVLATGGGAAVLARSGGHPHDRLITVAAPVFSPSPVASSVSRQDACPAGDPVHLPQDEGTVTDAFVCGSELRPVPGEGVCEFAVVRRVTGGLDQLLAAYSVPDDTTPVPNGSGCTTDLQDPRVVHLHTASGVVAARAPQDPCAHPTRVGVAAYDALSLTVVWEKRLRQSQSQESIDSSCSDAYKDMLYEDARYGGNAPSHADAPAPLVAPVLLCGYQDEVDAQGDRVGHLMGHATLTADQVRAVNDALAHVRTDPTCSRTEQRAFALLLSGPDLTPTLVALDGCAVGQGDGWWRAGDDLRALLR